MWQRAQARGIPLICAEDLLDFLQARTSARFTNLDSTSSTLRVELRATGGQDLSVMLPADGLQSVRVDGTEVTPTTSKLAGRAYALVTSSAPVVRIRASYT